MRMKHILSLFVIFNAFFLQAEARQCYDLFSSANSSVLKSAILNGVKIFNGNKDYIAAFANETVYLHGTSIDNLKRTIDGSHFVGSPIKDQQMLSEVFPHFAGTNVVHTFRSEKGDISDAQLKMLSLYAELAAKRFYLLRFLQNIKEFYNSFFLHELVDALEFDPSPRAVIEPFQQQGHFDDKPEVLAKLESSDLRFLSRKMAQRRGVILVLGHQVARHVVVENDVEMDGALVFISQKGIPLSDIKAIIPLSITERDELLQLLQSQNLK